MSVTAAAAFSSVSVTAAAAFSSMHWGEEYTQVNSSQKTLVKRLLKESTIDAVIGSHPHVVQKYTTMTNSAGAEVPVYYAIGNLLSNQRSEILNHGISTEEGALVDISIKYDKDKDKVQSLKTEAIPYWVDKYTDGKVKYRIIPLTGEYKNNEALKVSGHAQTCRQHCRDGTHCI